MAALIRFIKPCKKMRTYSLSFCVKNYIFQNLKIDKFSHSLSTSQFTERRRKKHVFPDILEKVERNKGIDGKKFSDLFSILKQEQKISAGDATILLHICSTGPFDVPPEKRIELVTSVWSFLEEQGVPMTVKMYNLKLQTLTCKITDFEPMQELAHIKSLGLSPDQVTFTILIDAFCEKGDISGAQLMLEEMKEQKIKINIDVFNSFISGYLNAGQLNEAVEAFELISSRHLLPTSDTFHRFALFFAKRGDVVSIQYYIDKASQWTCPLSQVMLLDIYKLLVSSGHTCEADKYLNTILSNFGVFQQKSFEKICQLVAEGFSEEAKNLLKIMPKLSLNENTDSGNGVFLLTAMVKNGYTAKSLMAMADDIAEFLPKSQPHSNALLQSYKAELPELALELLELMIANNHDMKIPYFIPAICKFESQNNLSQLLRTTSLMLTQDYKNYTPDLVHELVFCVLPAFYKLGLTKQDILNNHKDFTTLWNSVFFIKDVFNKDFQFAIFQANAEQLESVALQSIVFPNRSFPKHSNKDWEMKVRLMLDFFLKIPDFDKGLLENFANQMLMPFLKKDVDTLNQVLDIMIEKKVPVGRPLLCNPYVKELPEKIQDKLMSISVSLSEENLDQMILQGPSSVVPIMNLDIDENDLIQYHMRLKELKVNKNFNWFISQITSTAYCFAKWGALDEASCAFNELKNKTGMQYQPDLPLFLAACYLKDNNLKAALALVNEANSSTYKITIIDNISLKNNISKLFQNASNHSEVEAVKTSLLSSNLFKKHNIIYEYLNAVFGLVDDDTLMFLVHQAYTEHGAFPKTVFLKVLNRLITSQDMSNLRKAIDLGTAVMGRDKFHHLFAVSFLECGMPGKAQVVLQTAGLQIMQNELIQYCKHFVRNKNIKPLEDLVELSEDLPVKHCEILEHLVLGYVAIGDLDKAVNARSRLTDGNMVPKQATIITLENALKAKEATAIFLG